MKIFLPNRIIKNIARWIELIIYSLPYLFVLFILVELNVFNLLYYPQKYNFNVIFIFVFYSLYFFYNSYETSTIVDEIKIDNLNKIVSIKYSKYYILKRKCHISFNEFSFKFYDTIGLNNLSRGYEVDGLNYSYISVKIYNNNKKSIKLVSRNGWKKVIVDEIIDEFNKISITEKSPTQFL